MKYSKIVQLCKQNQTAIIAGNGGVQWISDGQAYYPLFLGTEFNTESLIALFDIGKKIADEMTLKELPLDSAINFEDSDEREVHASRVPLSIGYGGYMYIPFTVADKVLFMDQRYMQPLTDYEELEYYVRFRKHSGTSYFVAKTGFVIRAVIPVEDIADELFIKRLKHIYIKSAVSYERGCGTNEE